MIYFFDASEYYRKNGKKNELIDVGEIVAIVDNRKTIPYKAIVAEAKDTLAPNAYLEAKPKSDNPYAGLSLQEFSERVIREHREFRERLAKFDDEIEAVLKGSL